MKDLNDKAMSKVIFFMNEYLVGQCEDITHNRCDTDHGFAEDELRKFLGFLNTKILDDNKDIKVCRQMIHEMEASIESIKSACSYKL